MKQKGIVLLIFIVLLIVVGIVINILRNRAPKQGELKVESQPAASVFLENKHIGRTPIGKTPFKVDAGEYTIKIVPDAGITQLTSWQEKVKIGPNVLTYINASLSESELTTSSYVLWLEKITGKNSELSLTTTPDGATILFDDETKGVSPVTLPDITPGDHTITLVSRGFITRTIKVRFNAGYRLIASVKMALAPGGTDQQASSSATLGESTSSATVKITPTQKATGTPKATPTKTPVVSGSGVVEKPYVLIKDTPTGYLNVRSQPSSASAKLAAKPTVNPGDKYGFLELKDGWYQIKITASVSGWISSQYSEKVE